MFLKKIFNKINRNIDIIKVLVYKEWIIKYKGTYLGYIWSIAHPLILTLVFYVGFKIIMKVQIENYVLFLIVALFPWQWFSNSLAIGTWAFIANQSLIKKMVFPKYLLPLSNIIVDSIHFAISIPIIMLVLYFYNKPIFYLQWLLYIPLMFLLQTLLIFSIVLISSTLNVFYRDIDRIISLLIMLIMYASPIFYSANMIPKKLLPFFYLNPVFPLVNLWRDIFMNGNFNLFDLLILLIHIIFWLAIGFVVYKKYEAFFAERT